MANQKSFNSKTPKIVGGVTLSVIILIAIYFLLLRPKTTQETNVANLNSGADSNSSLSLNSGPTPSAQSSSSYKDGSYSATTKYQVPEESNLNSITIKLNLESGAIKSLSLETSYEAQESAKYDRNFKNSINSKVVGKKLDSASLSRVGGASLTTEAFNEALTKIMQQAKQ